MNRPLHDRAGCPPPGKRRAYQRGHHYPRYGQGKAVEGEVIAVGRGAWDEDGESRFPWMSKPVIASCSANGRAQK